MGKWLGFLKAAASQDLATLDDRVTWSETRIKLDLKAKVGQYYTSQWSSFSTLLTAIGSTTATVYVNSLVTLTANTTVPANVAVRDGGGSFALGNYDLTFSGPFEWGLRQAFDYTGTGEVTLDVNSVDKLRAQWWGGAASMTYPAPVDSGPAINRAIASAATTGGHLELTPGYWSSSVPITLPNQDFIFSGKGWDKCRIRYTGTTFQPFITVGDGVTQCVGVKIYDLTFSGGAYLQGKSKYLIYAPFFNAGCEIKNVMLRDSVGMIYIIEGFLCSITNLYMTTSTPNKEAAGITHSQWLEVFGTYKAPVMLTRMNVSGINGVYTYRVGSEISDGVTPWATVVLGGGGTGFNGISIESSGTWQNGATTYNLRSQSPAAFGQPGSGVDSSSFTSHLSGFYYENVYATLALLKAYGNSAVRISGIFFYNVWSDAYIVDNYSASDISISYGKIYRARANELFHVLTTSGVISKGATVLFDGVSLSSGERETDGSLSGGDANLFNMNDTDFPLGIVDGTERQTPNNVTPKIIDGYAATNEDDGAGLHYIQVSSGTFLKSNGKTVSNMHASESNLPVWYWIRPTTASKWYRVYVGAAGQAYLVQYDSRPTEPKGDWICEFETDGSIAVSSLIENYRLTTYQGEYVASRFVGFYSAAPTTGYWEVGDTVWNSEPSTSEPRGWRCTTAGRSGTWEAI